jgi:GNAT superfamily N-acetyltransferase
VQAQIMIICPLLDREVHARSAELLRLQHASYAVEAALIHDDRIPPLHETESDLVAAALSWLAAFENDRIVAALGYRVCSDTVDIARLMVDPTSLRQGYGRALVTLVLTVTPRARVSTGRENAPARALYERLGFTHTHDVEPVEGLWVSRYSRGAAGGSRIFCP